ncbi:hypothetical protein MCOR27_009387 [Pyricularia oryzae]|uniref:Cutinase n=1 Tax=Pyricularia grisea TaxID=148305 RepID=A0ABQ8NW31_PYRGI|nr:hypothetical protein MCOR01_006725 [Pyricularia oryzae]KAI6302958.1 hypothetical protein MCOR33_001735 [Pyricularia grisea]KAH9436045.1 hypothetical protein MCOR02_004954 [Pyricularia oryzae]KAI6254957.1 hypothetical protein MCOR19_008563 [Pyricularia oryzae]KAI6270269.1 hypothetical protein MCOR27_009387 [Pyricularia oryzae]
MLVAAGLLASLATALPASSIHRAEPVLETRQNRNTQTAAGPCADMTIVFARGTTERGNVGTVVGPPLLDAVKQLSNGLDVNMQGVDYPADVRGFMQGGDPQGSARMAGIIKALAADCPNTGIIISGYSQGAQLMHNAADQLDPASASHITAAVAFGDPLNGQGVTGVDTSRVLVICHDRDNICEGGAQIRQAHLTYGQDVGKAASFIMQAAAAGQGAGQGGVEAPGAGAGAGAN